MAQLFAKEGASVFLTARTEKELAKTAAEITEAGGRAKFLVGDLADEADCRAAFDKIVAEYGRVDILVNNGGHYGTVVPAGEDPEEEFDGGRAVQLGAAVLVKQVGYA